MSTEAQPPVVTPTPPVTPPETLTPEQNEADRIRRATSFLVGKIVDEKKPEEKKDEPKPDEQKPPATPEATATPPPEPEAKKPRKIKEKPVSAEKPAPLGPREIAEIAATTAAEFSKRKPEPEPEPDTGAVELAEEFQADREYYEWMQRENPKKYGNLIKRLSDWGPKELDYIEEWKTENPGREYDPDSDEHDEFYSKNQPKISATDLNAAKARVADVRKSLDKEKLKQEIRDEMAPELAEIRMQKVQRSAAPKLQAAAQGTIENILGGINPEYVQHAKDKAKLDEIGEADPIAADIGQRMVNKWVPLATEIVAFHQGVPFNKDNPAHVDMYYRTLKLEQLVNSLPSDQQMHEGKRFTTQEKFQRMSPDQRAQHWIIGEDELLYDIETTAKAETAALYKEKTEEHARYSKKKSPAPATNGKHSNPPPEPNPVRRQSAPSVVPGPSVTATPSGTQTQQKSGLDRFHERLLGGK